MEHADETPGAYYDAALGRIQVTDVTLDHPTVIGESRHWSTGIRSDAAEDPEYSAADLSAFVKQAVLVGAHAIRNAGGSQQTHRLDRLVADVGAQTAAASEAAAKSTAAATDQAAASLVKAAAEAQTSIHAAAKLTRESFTEQVTRSREQLSADITRLVGGEDPILGARLDAVLAKFGSELDERVGRRADELYVKAARQLDPRDPTSPLAAVTQQLGQQYAALAAQFGESQKDVTARLDALSTAVQVTAAAATATAITTAVSPLKGIAYEDGIHQRAAAFAVRTGDEYLDTSGVAGRISRCFKGDGVLTITLPTGRVRVVIEMTDSDTIVRGWNDYLDQSERNRGADVSLGLVRTVEQMPDSQRLRVFGPRRLVLAHDPAVDAPDLLDTVLLLLRSQAIAAAQRTAGADLQCVEEKINEALACLDKLNEVQKHAGSIRRSADKIDADCSGITTTMRRLLDAATAALPATGTTSTLAA